MTDNTLMFALLVLFLVFWTAHGYLAARFWWHWHFGDYDYPRRNLFAISLGFGPMAWIRLGVFHMRGTYFWWRQDNPVLKLTNMQKILR